MCIRNKHFPTYNKKPYMYIHLTGLWRAYIFRHKTLAHIFQAFLSNCVFTVSISYFLTVRTEHLTRSLFANLYHFVGSLVFFFILPRFSIFTLSSYAVFYFSSWYHSIPWNRSIRDFSKFVWHQTNKKNSKKMSIRKMKSIGKKSIPSNGKQNIQIIRHGQKGKEKCHRISAKCSYLTLPFNHPHSECLMLAVKFEFGWNWTE